MRPEDEEAIPTQRATVQDLIDRVFLHRQSPTTPHSTLPSWLRNTSFSAPNDKEQSP